ncbi:Arrestin C-terminal-like domain-containing protein [Entamoeba marina]
MIVEHPMGTYRFPFTFVLPPDFQPTMHDKSTGIGYTYNICGVIYTPTNIIEGKLHLFPVRYSHPKIPQSFPISTNKTIGGIMITLDQPKQHFERGETMKLFMKVKKLNAEIPSIQVALVAVYNQEMVLLKHVYSKVLFQPCDCSYATPIDVLIPKDIPPTVTSSNFNWDYYIRIRSFGKEAFENMSVDDVIENHRETFFPIKIYATPPEDKESNAEKDSGRAIKMKTSPIIPGYPLNCYNGIEKAMTSDGTILFLDHFERKVYEDENKLIPSTTVYPCIESVTLPPGLVFAYHCNKRYVIDHKNKQTYAEDELTIPIHSQSEINDCLKPVITIHVMEGCGFIIPSIYCEVLGVRGKKVKSSEEKSMDPIFHNATFVLRPSINRKNIVVYFFDQTRSSDNKYVGSVEFDLTKIPFDSYLEGWFYLRSSPYGEEPFTGKVRIKFGYAAHAKGQSEDVKYIGDVWCCSTQIHYPKTKQMLEQVENQNEIKKKK